MEFLISITGKLFANAIMKHIENNMKRIKSRLKGRLRPAKIRLRFVLNDLR